MKRHDIEVGGSNLTVFEDCDTFDVCEHGNGDGLLFSVPVKYSDVHVPHITAVKYGDVPHVTALAGLFLLGRQRGQREGRNQVRSQLGSIINNVEAV